MVPGLREAAHVDGLPSGQRGGIGQDGGELLPVAGAQRVTQAGLGLADMGLQLGGDGGCTEAAIEQPDRFGFALQGGDTTRSMLRAAVICRTRSVSRRVRDRAGLPSCRC